MRVLNSYMEQIFCGWMRTEPDDGEKIRDPINGRYSSTAGYVPVYTKLNENAPAENRTRGPTMATLDFTTKPLVPDADQTKLSSLYINVVYCKLWCGKMKVWKEEMIDDRGPQALCYRNVWYLVVYHDCHR